LGIEETAETVFEVVSFEFEPVSEQGLSKAKDNNALPTNLCGASAP